MSARWLTAFVLVAAFSALVSSTRDECNAKCDAEKEETREVCKNGCELYDFNGGFPGRLGGDESALEKCKRVCVGSKDCIKGCTFGSETSGFDDGGITISFGRMPQIFDLGRPGVVDLRSLFDIPSAFGLERSDHVRPVVAGEKKEEGEEERRPLGIASMFDNLHNMMRGMMIPMFGGLSEDGDTSMPLKHSGGELVVIKSGPGYHEEKKYHLGPNANIDEILEHSMDDMMEHNNPIEKFREMNDIEVFDPAEFLASSKPEAAEKGDNVVVRANDLFDTDPWGFIREGPMLPETGLKSERTMGEPWERDLEPQSSRTWTDWFTNLRMKAGLPNWLMAASVALGVIFTLWLCMIIPSGASKKKFKRAKMIGTKEAEAELGISTVLTSDYTPNSKVDLPPSYDDVSKRGNPEPVHGLIPKVALEGDEAGPLPEKNDKNLA